MKLYNVCSRVIVIFININFSYVHNVNLLYISPPLNLSSNVKLIEIMHAILIVCIFSVTIAKYSNYNVFYLLR